MTWIAQWWYYFAFLKISYYGDFSLLWACNYYKNLDTAASVKSTPFTTNKCNWRRPLKSWMKNYLMDWGFPENQFNFLNKGQLQIWHSAILRNGIIQDLSSSYEKKKLSYFSPPKKMLFYIFRKCNFH